MVRMRSRVQAPIVAPYETRIRRNADLFHQSDAIDIFSIDEKSMKYRI